MVVPKLLELGGSAAERALCWGTFGSAAGPIILRDEDFEMC